MVLVRKLKETEESEEKVIYFDFNIKNSDVAARCCQLLNSVKCCAFNSSWHYSRREEGLSGKEFFLEKENGSAAIAKADFSSGEILPDSKFHICGLDLASASALVELLNLDLMTNYSYFWKVEPN